jgi:hypothetical protein
MMTDEQRSRVAKVKAAIAASDRAKGGVPQAIRGAVFLLKQELRAVGTTARALAAMLGVHETTLCRWGRESRAEAMVGAARPTVSRAHRRRGGAGFRMVQVGGQAKTVALVSPTSGGLRVAHAPSGIVVDGLDVETLAALLRRLS